VESSAASLYPRSFSTLGRLNRLNKDSLDCLRSSFVSLDTEATVGVLVVAGTISCTGAFDLENAQREWEKEPARDDWMGGVLPLL